MKAKGGVCRRMSPLLGSSPIANRAGSGGIASWHSLVGALDAGHAIRKLRFSLSSSYVGLAFTWDSRLQALLPQVCCGGLTRRTGRSFPDGRTSGHFGTVARWSLDWLPTFRDPGLLVEVSGLLATDSKRGQLGRSDAPNPRVQRTRSTPSARHERLTRHPLGATMPDWSVPGGYPVRGRARVPRLSVGEARSPPAGRVKCVIPDRTDAAPSGRAAARARTRRQAARLVFSASGTDCRVV